MIRLVVSLLKRISGLKCCGFTVLHYAACCMNKLFFLPLIFILNSCIVFHSGNISSGPLLKVNDSYQDIATGISNSTFVLGLGSANNNELIQAAKRDLYFNRPLQKNEYYANFTVDINRKIILFIVLNIHVTVNADVIRSNDSTNEVFGETFLKRITPVLEVKDKHRYGNASNNDAHLLSNGDSIYFSRNKKDFKLYTISALDKESVILNPIASKEKSSLVFIYGNTFFVKSSGTKAFNIEEKVEFDVIDPYYNLPVAKKGIVNGYAKDLVLIKADGLFYAVDITKLKKLH
jgi:hypothetical protein